MLLQPMKPCAAKNITYAFKDISGQAFKISTPPPLHNASLLFLTIFGNLIFDLNFLGLMSMSEYSEES